jgi:hypoxanthine phosphoribosyltransferase
MDVRKLPKTVDKLARAIRRHNLKFNAVAFRGMSGALVVPMLCLKLRKGMICCRKKSEESHSAAAEGYMGGGNYIIVDDFINSGTTISGIITAIEDWQKQNKWEYPIDRDHNKMPKFVPIAVFLYNKDKAEPPDFSESEHPELNIPVYGMKE